MELVRSRQNKKQTKKTKKKKKKKKQATKTLLKSGNERVIMILSKYVQELLAQVNGSGY